MKRIVCGCLPIYLPLRFWRFGFALIVICAACALARSAETLVLEDFESFQGDALIVPVGQGKGVTHGRQAVMFRAGGSVVVKLAGLDPNATPWIRLDSLTTQPLVQPIILDFLNSDGRSLYRVVGHVQPGSDTLSLPVWCFAGRVTGEWPGSLVSVRVTNPGPEAVMIDYVRAEPVVAAPNQSVMLDFGPKKQVRWPGFMTAGNDDPAWVWANQWRGHGDSRSYPDGLTGDYVGPTAFGNTEKITIVAPGSTPVVAWIWLTHDFGSHYPPAEYAFQVNGKTVLRSRLTAKQFFSDDGLMRGRGGDWTARWYSKDFSERLSHQLKVTLRPGANRVNLLNCQVAAMVMGPASNERAMKQFVDQVNRDVQRYRRQFVVATRRQILCTVQPTAEQQQVGMMVFSPRGQRPFEAGWVPQDANEVKLVRCTALAGSTALAALAVVPTKPLSLLMPSVETTSTEGQSLRLAAQSCNAWVVDRIPNAHEGMVDFVPWLLRSKARDIKKDEILHVAVAIGVSAKAAEGVYRGSIRLNHGGSQVRIPLELKVLRGPVLDRPPTFLPTRRVETPMFYGGLSATFSKSQKGKFRRDIHSLLSARGLNAFWISGPTFSTGRSLVETDMIGDLQDISRKFMTGRWLLNLRTMRDKLRNVGITFGTSKYKLVMSAAISRYQARARKLRLPEPLCYFGYHWDIEAEKELQAEAAGLARMGAKLVFLCTGSFLSRLEVAERKRILQPYAALFVSDGVANMGDLIKEYKALGSDRLVLVWQTVPERYAVGFRSAALGGDGVYVDAVMPRGPVYDGLGRLGAGFAVADADGSLIGTLGSLIFHQGVDDFTLWKKCEQLLEKADRTGTDVAGLRAVMAEIQRKVLAFSPRPISGGLVDKNINPIQLEQWRMSLLGQLEALQARPVAR